MKAGNSDFCRRHSGVLRHWRRLVHAGVVEKTENVDRPRRCLPADPQIVCNPNEEPATRAPEMGANGHREAAAWSSTLKFIAPDADSKGFDGRSGVLGPIPEASRDPAAPLDPVRQRGCCVATRQNHPPLENAEDLSASSSDQHRPQREGEGDNPGGETSRNATHSPTRLILNRCACHEWTIHDSRRRNYVRGRGILFTDIRSDTGPGVGRVLARAAASDHEGLSVLGGFRGDPLQQRLDLLYRAIEHHLAADVVPARGTLEASAQRTSCRCLLWRLIGGARARTAKLGTRDAEMTHGSNR